MATFISKNLIKTSVELGKHGQIISKTTSTSRGDEMQQKQEERARKLGFRGPRTAPRR